VFGFSPVGFMLQAVHHQQIKTRPEENFQCNFLYFSRFLYT
jgi:hypothetical protein